MDKERETANDFMSVIKSDMFRYGQQPRPLKLQLSSIAFKEFWDVKMIIVLLTFREKAAQRSRAHCMTLLASSRGKRGAFIFPTPRPSSETFPYAEGKKFPLFPTHVTPWCGGSVSIARRVYLRSFGIIWFLFLCLVNLFFTVNLSHIVSRASSVLVLWGPAEHPRSQNMVRRHGASEHRADLQPTALMDLTVSVEGDAI